MSEKIESIDKFHSLLVEYLNTFNLLEMNVGACISFLETSSREDSYLSLAQTSCKRKIENLYEIVKTTKILKSSRNLQELEEWCENAHQMRHQRNYYIHGVWSFVPHLDRVELNVAPWFKGKYEGGSRMNLHEFSIIVQELTDCFIKLKQIREKNGI